MQDTWACDNPDSKPHHEIKEDTPNDNVADSKPEVKSEKISKPEVKSEDISKPEVKSEDSSKPEVESSTACHVMGPYKKAKFVCNPLTKRCRVACRRKYNSVYNEYNELKCLNGKWLTYRSSELVGTG